MNRALYQAILNRQIAAANQMPQLAPLIMALSFQENPDIPTEYITKDGVVNYNPADIERAFKVGPRDVSDIILHETLHLFLDAWGRQMGRESQRWNAAHDLEIAHYVLPSDTLNPAGLNLPQGLTAEQYYDLLPKSQPCKCSQHAAPTSGDLPAHVQSAVIQAAENIVKGARAGHLAGLRKRALQLVSPAGTIPALRHIYGSLISSGQTDYSYERPNRRHDGAVIMPSLIHREPRAICILDVSGSMGGHLEPACKLVMAAVQSLGVGLDVLAWDTQPVQLAHVRTAQDLSKLSASGGGTDMAAALLSVPARGNFDCILLVTDCGTPWPTAEQMRRLPPTYVLSVAGGHPPTYMKEIVY